MNKKLLPKDKNIYETKCPILYAMEVMGQKWKLPIMWYIGTAKTVRYGELQKKVIGITATMLTKCLRELEDDGLIKRKQYSTISPAVEYSYTKNAPSLSGDELVTLQNETLASLQPYLSKKKIVGVQANKLAAEIAYEKEDYNASIQYYLAQAHADENSYTAAVAYFMVASSYEELSNFEEAEKYYGLASEQSDFLLVPHALFNLARVKESRGDKDGAVLVYKQMVSDYPNDDWTNLAQSRLISLNASGIVE